VNRNRLMACLIAAPTLFTQACGRAAADSPTPAANVAPRMLSVALVDRSMSRTPDQLNADRTLLDGLIQDLGFGDRFVLAQVHADGQGDIVKRWIDHVPDAADATAATPVEIQSLQQWRNAGVKAARALFDSTRANHTDLLASFADVADYLSESRLPKARLIVFSDMLQSTPDFDMESRDSVPGAAWIQNRLAHGQLPNLKGLCVVVVGAQSRSARDVAVRRFWQNYFQTSGATLKDSDYRYTATDPAGLRC